MDAEIKIDYDCNEVGFKRKFKRIKNVLEIEKFIKVQSVKIHQTGKGFHVRLFVSSPRRLSLSHILHLQTLLGSDYMREAFNFLRQESDCEEESNILYSKKWQYGKDGKKEILSFEKSREDLEKLFMEKIGRTPL